MMASTSAPESTSSMIAACPGRKSSKPKTARSVLRAAARSPRCELTKLTIEMAAHDVKKDAAVLGKLHLAHAVDGAHVGLGPGLAPRHVDQAPVGEDQIGR